MSRIRVRSFRRLSALALVAFGTLPLWAEAEGSGLIKGGEPPALLLLYTGDVIGYVDPCG